MPRGYSAQKPFYDQITVTRLYAVFCARCAITVTQETLADANEYRRDHAAWHALARTKEVA